MSEHPLRLKTGIAGLDQVLDGGFIEGASYIIQGEPGAGKTILANQLAFANLRVGRRVIYVTLLAETHERLFHALDTMNFFDKSYLGSEIVYVSVFQILREKGLAAVVSLLRQETARQKATLLIFDGLLNVRDRAHSDLDIKTFIAELQSQAAFVGCTVLFLASAQLRDESPEHTMVDGVIELRNETIGVRAVRRLRVRKSRGIAALNGFHEFEIGCAGITVYPRFELARSLPTVPDQPSENFLSSGIAGLDPLMGGGLRSGSVTLLFGPSGAGKTSMGLSFLHAASPEEPALHFGFYETQPRLIQKARAIGLDPHKVLDDGLLEICWLPMTENMLDKLGHELLEAVGRRRSKRLFIDGFRGFVRAAVHPPRMVEFFAALTNELRALDVTTMVTWELDDLFSPTLSAPDNDICSMADNLILLRQVEKHSKLKRMLCVMKVRDSAHETHLYEVGMGNEGLEIRVPLEPASGVATGSAMSHSHSTDEPLYNEPAYGDDHHRGG